MDGYTAIRYFQEVPQRVKIGVDEYRFEVKANVCMAWVKDEHVKQVLEITRVCCGGQRNHPYRVASEQNVRAWMGIDR
jgi:hypothetical protein